MDTVSSPSSRTISRSNASASAQAAPSASGQRVFSLLLKALFALCLRLWIATLSISMIMYFLRRIPVSPLLHHSGRIITDKPVLLTLNDREYHATPALFGGILNDELKGPVMFITHDGCEPFQVHFPQQAQKVQDPQDTTDAMWVGVVQRGGCPFDQKVLNMQKAGFKAVIVFNHHNEDVDAIVRMSAHSLATEIHSFAFFMSRGSGMDLATRIIGQDVNYLTIKPLNTIWLSKDILWRGMMDMLILLFLVILTGSSFLLFGLVINLAHNLFVHRRMYLLETVQEAADLILTGGVPPPLPKLEKIEFPIRMLTTSDFGKEWSCGGVKGHENCPICIEEFATGDKVRDLPCRHIFHSLCIDPWLLKHNRLCPVCKRDVLEEKKIA